MEKRRRNLSVTFAGRAIRLSVAAHLEVREGGRDVLVDVALVDVDDLVLVALGVAVALQLERVREIEQVLADDIRPLRIARHLLAADPPVRVPEEVLQRVPDDVALHLRRRPRQAARARRERAGHVRQV